MSIDSFLSNFNNPESKSLILIKSFQKQSVLFFMLICLVVTIYKWNKIITHIHIHTHLYKFGDNTHR